MTDKHTTHTTRMKTKTEMKTDPKTPHHGDTLRGMVPGCVLACLLGAALALPTAVPAAGTTPAAPASSVVEAGAHTPVRPITVGIVEYVRPAPMEPIVERSLNLLERRFGPGSVVVRRYTLAELKKAVEESRVDFFMSSAGFYRRMTAYGARPLATAVSARYPDPNRNDGAAIVVAASRKDLQSIDDLKGRRLITSSPTAFTGYHVPLGVIADAGHDPETFFGSVDFVGGGDDIRESLPKLLKNEGDVAFVRLCFLEKWLQEHPGLEHAFRVVHDVTGEGEACRRSTPLYPAWTFASVRRTDPTLSREVMKTLLSLTPDPGDGLYWSLSTDTSSVDRLFKTLRIGPYAYLREWTVKRVWEHYHAAILLFIFGVVGLILHSVRVGVLVRRRTAMLQTSLSRERALRRAAAASARRIARLEKVSALGQLSTIFAHEMRQPLGAISLYTFAVKRKLSEILDSEDPVFAILGKIEGQTARADAIVNRVRRWAKAETPPRKTVDWVDVARGALHELEGAKPAAEMKEAAVNGKAGETGEAGASNADTAPEIVLHAPAPVMVHADPLGLELVVFNLVKNALEAAPRDHAFQAKGTVEVTLERTVNNHGAPEAVLVVRNHTGPVADADWAAVSQAGSGAAGTDAGLDEALPATTKSEGLGLGLGIVRGFVESHAGRLLFTRHEDGLEARVVLPAVDEADDEKDVEKDVERDDEAEGDGEDRVEAKSEKTSDRAGAATDRMKNQENEVSKGEPKA